LEGHDAQEAALMGAAVMSLATDVIFTVDAKTLKLCHANRAFSRLLGYEPHEITGLTIFDVVVTERANLDQSIATLARDGEVSIPLRQYRAKHGGLIDVELRASVTHVQGRTLYCAVARDLTPIRAAEARVRESEERFKLLADVAFEGIAITEGGRIVDVNQRFTELLRAPVQQLIGRPVSDFVAPEDRDRVIQSLRSGLPGPYEHTVLRTDETRFRAEVRAATVQVANRSLRVTALRDISERRALEEQVRLAQRMESVGRLAGGVAHDFNNLLTVILSVTRLLSEDPANGALEGDLGEITLAARRASELTQQLLAFARRQIVNPEVININDLVVTIEKMLRRVIGENIVLTTHCAKDLGNVRADTGQVEQVLMNLALNARDAMKHGGTLTLETANVSLGEDYTTKHPDTVPGAYVMMSVTDTGIGMDAPLMQHIFEPFFTTKELGKGTGLGLATCYGIVKQCGGSIWVYSEPGKGTTFKVYLPRVWDAAEERPATKHETQIGGHETLLVVEDNDMVRRIAVRVLQAHGYNVIQSKDGDDALRVYATTSRVDLLITDVVLPTINGKQLADALRRQQGDLRVLYTSGYTENTIVHQGVVDPDVHFLAKPYVPSDLLHKVRKALDEP
jgi:PAS domain S-box-containing protein